MTDVHSIKVRQINYIWVTPVANLMSQRLHLTLVCCTLPIILKK